MNKTETKEILDCRLGDALRASEITRENVEEIQTMFAVMGKPGSHRIVSAMHAIKAWLSALNNL